MNAESIAKLYENRKNLIKVDDYKKGGVLDTQYLERFDESKSFENSFIKPDGIKFKKQIKNVMLFYNPSAGINNSAYILINDLTKILRKHAIKYIVIKSAKKRHFVEYLKNVNNKMNIINKYKIDVFVVSGGDGTYNEFINGYMFGEYTEYNIPIMFVPGGSFNVLYHQLNPNKNIVSDFEQYLTNNEFNLRYIDIMKTSNTLNGGDVAYSFDTLFGTTTLFKIREKLRSIPIFGRYGAQIASPIVLLKNDILRYKLIAYFNDNNDDNDKCEFYVGLGVLFCCKTKRIGHVIAAPCCKSDNGFMDIYIQLHRSTYHILKLYVKDLPFGTQILNTKEKGVIFLRCKKLQIMPLDNNDNDRCSIDAEMGPYTPCIVETIQNILPVITM